MSPPPRPPARPAAAPAARAALQQAFALEARGDLAGALAAADAAAAAAPGFVDAHAKRAQLRLALGDREGAVASYRAAAAAGPKSPLGRICEARAFIEQQRDDEAVRSLKRTLAMFPDLAPAHALLGLAHAEAGRFDASIDSLDRALALDPGQAALWYDRVRARTLTPAERPLVARMEAAQAQPGLSPRARMGVLLALGKAAEDFGEPQAAMGWWRASAQAAAAAAPFDRARLTRTVDAMIGAFTPQLFARLSRLGDPDELPMLIVGMPRSGTTLVEQILSSHREVAGAGELDLWPKALERLPLPPDEAALTRLCGEMRGPYLAALRKAGPRARRVTDKLPVNFLALGFFHLLFPQGRIVHCRRAPIDIALSIYATFFAPNPRFPARAEDIVFYLGEYARLMHHWRDVLPPERFLEVDYEALTADPEGQARALVAFAGLAWDPACLAPEKNPRAVRTASKWQARQPVHRGSVDRWRRFAPWLGPFEALLSLDQKRTIGSA